MLTDVVTSKEEAKKDIKGSLIGLLIVLGAVLVLMVINPQLVNVNFNPDRTAPPPPVGAITPPPAPAPLTPPPPSSTTTPGLPPPPSSTTTPGLPPPPSSTTTPLSLITTPAPNPYDPITDPASWALYEDYLSRVSASSTAAEAEYLRILAEAEAQAAAALAQPSFEDEILATTVFRNCGSLNPARRVDDTRNDTVFACLGNAFAEGCAPVSVRYGEEMVYMTLLDGSCQLGQTYTPSLIDVVYRDTALLCSAVSPGQTAEDIRGLRVPVSTSGEQVFNLVGELLQRESDLEALLASGVATPGEIMVIEDDIIDIRNQLILLEQPLTIWVDSISYPNPHYSDIGRSLIRINMTDSSNCTTYNNP